MCEVVVAGSRYIKDYKTVKEAIEDSGFDISKVISGGAEGVDTLAENWAEENTVDVERYPYEDFLDEYDPKVAPIKRNEEMASVAEKAIIIWDGESPGTKNMLENSQKEDLDIHIHRTDIKSFDNF